MVIEQAPRPENRITLAKNTLDAFGNPLAQIEWSVSDEDIKNLHIAVDTFEKTWNSSKLAKMARFARRPGDELARELVRGGGIYHPGGTTRMSTSANSGVVDEHLRVFGLANLRVVSTSVLPTGGGGNPTMMLLMLGLRCVDDLAGKGLDAARL
jgi:choline dehydrogenase-like flavoprotein